MQGSIHVAGNEVRVCGLAEIIPPDHQRKVQVRLARSIYICQRKGVCSMEVET